MPSLNARHKAGVLLFARVHSLWSRAEGAGADGKCCREVGGFCRFNALLTADS